MDHKKQFYRSLFAIVFPIVLQNLITSAVNSADVFMLGYVGQTELSAVSLANQFQFILHGFFFGLTSGIVMLASQYWGRKDLLAIQAIMGIAFKLAFVFGLVLSVGAIVCPELFMKIYTDEAELIPIGAKYLRVVGITYVLMSFSQTYESTLRSVEKAGISTVISTSALSLNILLNAVFIFGWFGLPKMGVFGVALATVIARVIELILCLIHMFKSKIFDMQFKIFFGHHPVLFKDFLRYSIPALLNDLVWTFAFSSYSIILGHLNADIVAANSVVSTVRNLCTTVCFGLGSGGSVILGKEIGENRLDLAKEDAGRLCRATLVSGVVMGGILLLMRPLVFMFFDLNERATDYLNVMLWINSYYITGQAINTTIISGVFRAGGDSRFGLICDIICMWVLCVPLGFISAFVIKLPPIWVYFVLCLDEFWKIPVVYKYYMSYRWLKNITRDKVV